MINFMYTTSIKEVAEHDDGIEKHKFEFIGFNDVKNKENNHTQLTGG